MLHALAAATLSVSDPTLSMVEPYLRRFGGPKFANLKPLSMRYGDNLIIHGNESLLDLRTPVLEDASALHVSYDSGLNATALLFIDIDAMKPPEDLSLPGHLGPFTHSMWDNCVGRPTAADASTVTITPCRDCRSVKPYLKPGCARPQPNRYTFILFAQSPAYTSVRGLPRATGKKFDLGAFATKNPELRPVAVNYMLVHGTGKPRNKRRKLRQCRRRD